MREGDWVRLGPTLSFGEGRYKIVTLGAHSITVRGEDGRHHALLKEQFENLINAPATPKRRYGKKADFFDHNVGMLAGAGYHVGTNGLGKARRRAILTWVFEASPNELPRVGNEEYRSQWGESRSARRFNKITSCLWAFAQNGLARRDQPREAVEDWQDDLQWFYETHGDHLIH